uniref:AP2/ERF transcription factor n=1 Tax=Camptotheca acuminata TaxID=16922 RepID=A0A7G8AUA9_CAMAC|nr:AP2/ERF transcription factor [Camptotheca acuminata]
MFLIRPQGYYQEHEHYKNNRHFSGINEIAKGDQEGTSSPSKGTALVRPFGRKKLFDKVVTQSDLKQYRLAIPKLQAKKHFPLNVSSNGILLCMADNEGKVWRFRYAFWKSTQTYVLTSEWNQFVKEKGLNAGDVVSFWRSTRLTKQLYIDWERRRMSSIITKPDPLIIPIQQGEDHQVVKLFGVNISST